MSNEDEYFVTKRYNRVQRASEGKRYGDTNKEHNEAVKRVVLFWAKHAHPEYNKWLIDNSWVEQYSQKFIRDNKLVQSGRDHFFHTPDLVFYEWHEDQCIPKLIIEIDGESHDSKSRKIADGLFEEWITIHYKGYVKVIRLKKAELELDLTLAHEYLWQELKEFLQ